MSKSGYYIRMIRDGKWGSHDICELTDAELDEFIRLTPKDRHGMWVKALASWIRDNVVDEQQFIEEGAGGGERQET